MNADTTTAAMLLRIARIATHRRSNGIQVPRAVARLIRSGDRARGAGEWGAADRHYRAALERRPDLAHIWIQAGHAAKESGRLDRAASAYRRAAALSAGDPEPHIHLGHVAKLAGALETSAAHYLDALRRDPESLAAASELIRTVDGREAGGAAILTEAMAHVGLSAPPPEQEGDDEGAVDAGIFFDVTDLMAYFSHARLPTGIQRVQIELVAAAMRHGQTVAVEACCFSEARKGWSLLPRARFLALVAASLESDDRADSAWRRTVVSALLSQASGPNLRFGPASVLVNLGSSWSDRNYFLHLRNARAAGGPRYLPLIHDVIPMLRPEWFPASLIGDFATWIETVLSHSDRLLANSQATAADVRTVAAGLGRPVAADALAVTPLDADFRRPHAHRADDARLTDWGVTPGGFVLMVSTLEPRKNHLGAFAAWRELIDRLPADSVPDLVCVGGRGWMNDRVHAELARDAALRSKVKLLHGVADADLALLYRHCLFTVYPSHYEGWGLPITEALCYGKVPAISSTSAMPEAGGRFAAYFDPGDVATIAATLARLIAEPHARETMEDAIRTGFRPRAWDDIAAQVLAQAEAATRDELRALPPQAGRRFAFGAPRPAGLPSGETLRTGQGWAPPGPTGSGILPGGAVLRLPPEAKTLDAIRLRIVATPGDAVGVRVLAGGRIVAEARLEGGTSRWLALSAAAGSRLPGTIELLDMTPPATPGAALLRSARLVLSEIAVEDTA